MTLVPPRLPPPLSEPKPVASLWFVPHWEQTPSRPRAEGVAQPTYLLPFAPSIDTVVTAPTPPLQSHPPLAAATALPYYHLPSHAQSSLARRQHALLYTSNTHVLSNDANCMVDAAQTQMQVDLDG